MLRGKVPHLCPYCASKLYRAWGHMRQAGPEMTHSYSLYSLNSTCLAGQSNAFSLIPSVSITGTFSFHIKTKSTSSQQKCPRKKARNLWGIWVSSIFVKTLNLSVMGSHGGVPTGDSFSTMVTTWGWRVPWYVCQSMFYVSLVRWSWMTWAVLLTSFTPSSSRTSPVSASRP